MDDCNEILAKDVTGYLGTPPRACPPKVAKRRVGLQLSDTGVNKKTGPLKMTKRTHFKQHHMLQPERLTPKWDGHENRRKRAKTSAKRVQIAHRITEGAFWGKKSGEVGIRTLDTRRYNGFRDRRFRPLSHLSDNR
jgi:hypothetical protein